jgi:hypothetical protein
MNMKRKFCCPCDPLRRNSSDEEYTVTVSGIIVCVGTSYLDNSSDPYGGAWQVMGAMSIDGTYTATKNWPATACNWYGGIITESAINFLWYGGSNDYYGWTISIVVVSGAIGVGIGLTPWMGGGRGARAFTADQQPYRRCKPYTFANILSACADGDATNETILGYGGSVTITPTA